MGISFNNAAPVPPSSGGGDAGQVNQAQPSVPTQALGAGKAQLAADTPAEWISQQLGPGDKVHAVMINPIKSQELQTSGDPPMLMGQVHCYVMIKHDDGTYESKTIDMDYHTNEPAPPDGASADDVAMKKLHLETIGKGYANMQATISDPSRGDPSHIRERTNGIKNGAFNIKYDRAELEQNKSVSAVKIDLRDGSGDFKLSIAKIEVVARKSISEATESSVPPTRARSMGSAAQPKDWEAQIKDLTEEPKVTAPRTSAPKPPPPRSPRTSKAKAAPATPQEPPIELAKVPDEPSGRVFKHADAIAGAANFEAALDPNEEVLPAQIRARTASDSATTPPPARGAPPKARLTEANADGTRRLTGAGEEAGVTAPPPHRSSEPPPFTRPRSTGSAQAPPTPVSDRGAPPPPRMTRLNDDGTRTTTDEARAKGVRPPPPPRMRPRPSVDAQPAAPAAEEAQPARPPPPPARFRRPAGPPPAAKLNRPQPPAPDGR